MTSYKLGRDRNGNKVLHVRPTGFRAFSIQTLGNLPKTDRHGIGDWTLGEVSGYVEKFGTKKQCVGLGIYRKGKE